MATNTTGYVLTAGVNVPSDKRPRIERGEEVAKTDFPSEAVFGRLVKRGVVVKAGTAAGKAAKADAPKGGA